MVSASAFFVQHEVDDRIVLTRHEGTTHLLRVGAVGVQMRHTVGQRSCLDAAIEHRHAVTLRDQPQHQIVTDVARSTDNKNILRHASSSCAGLTGKS